MARIATRVQHRNIQKVNIRCGTSYRHIKAWAKVPKELVWKPWDDVVLGDSRWTKVERSIDRIRKAHKNKRLDHFRGTGVRNGTQEDYDTMASKYTHVSRWRKWFSSGAQNNGTKRKSLLWESFPKELVRKSWEVCGYKSTEDLGNEEETASVAVINYSQE